MKLWGIGISAIIFVTIITVALIETQPTGGAQSMTPGQAGGQNTLKAAAAGNYQAYNAQLMKQAMQQAALSPGCTTCPNVTQCFPNATPAQKVAFNPACPTPAQQQVAFQNPTGGGTAPPIFRDATMPHQYRGVCSNCHVIKPDIAIQRNAVMPHTYRGVCSNCHTISGTGAGAGAQ